MNFRRLLNTEVSRAVGAVALINSIMAISLSQLTLVFFHYSERDLFIVQCSRFT